MKNIRLSKKEDVSRITEILVFAKRMNFRSIFHNDDYSFNELQVMNVIKEFLDHEEIFEHIWVYDDGIVKGLIQIEGKEVKTLYVEPFFQNEGIGGKLLEFAVGEFQVEYLWALEENVRALDFYQRHGFVYHGEWKYEEGTTEHLIKLEKV